MKREIKPFYTLNEVCEILNLTRPTVLKAIREGKIKAVKFGKVWRIPHDTLPKAD